VHANGTAFELGQESEAGWESACHQACPAWDSWTLACSARRETLAGFALASSPKQAYNFAGADDVPRRISGLGAMAGTSPMRVEKSPGGEASPNGM